MYVSKWPHFERLRFLEEFVAPKKSTSNLMDNEDSEIVTGDAIDDDNDNDTELTELQEIEDQHTAEDQVHSTKRPTKNREQRSSKKRKEMQEDILLQKALSCMEKVGASTSTQPISDDDNIFAQYIATELRAIEDAKLKRYVKWKIQSLIFNAHSPGFMEQQLGYMHPGSSWEYQRQDLSPNQYSGQSSHGPSPTPSHYSISSPPFPVRTDGPQF